MSAALAKIAKQNPEDKAEAKEPEDIKVMKEIVCDVKGSDTVYSKITNLTYTDHTLTIAPDISILVNLEQIWLNRNKIQSIESLWRMQMPKIRKLSYSYNNITKIKVIRKITCPFLDQLQLDHNQIKEEDGLWEGKYNSKIDIWIYFGQKSLEKDNLNKRLDKKLHPLKMRT